MNTPHDKAHRLPLRTRRIFHSDGSMTSHLSVFCPRRDTSLAVRECLACPRCDGLTIHQSDHESELTCRHDDPPVAESSGKRIFSTHPTGSAASRAKVSDVMSRSVICVAEDVTVETAIALIVHHEIGAVPVTDADGRPLGVLSKTDLVRDQYEQSRTAGDETMSLASSELEPGFHEEVARTAIVRDVMTPIAFTLHENGTLSQAAALMAYEEIHRLPVTDQDGRVVGVLSSLDVLEWLAREDGYVLVRRERVPIDAG